MERSCWIIEWSAMDIQAGKSTSRKETSICWLFQSVNILNTSHAPGTIFLGGGGCAGCLLRLMGSSLWFLGLAAPWRMGS